MVQHFMVCSILLRKKERRKVEFVLNLSGVEPWTFYILNGLLNFNIIYPLAFIGIVLSVWK